VNVGPTPVVAGKQISLKDDSIHQEISRRWSAQRMLDEAVAAIRVRDANHAITLAESPTLQTHLQSNRAVLAALLATMITNGHSAMLDYVQQKLRADPRLVHERYSYGRTLLHAAAAAANLALVELLLQLGAEPDRTDAGGHTPLYCVGNECKMPDGAKVVRVLVQAGANVNARDGAKRCSALHMAARRGNKEIAEALLDCGADIEAPDSLGDTPLRRSVNCNKPDVAALLVQRGADIHSRGSKKLTPLLAARSTAMRRLLESPRPKHNR
jgi:hypothetical protein